MITAAEARKIALSFEEKNLEKELSGIASSISTSAKKGKFYIERKRISLGCRRKLTSLGYLVIPKTKQYNIIDFYQVCWHYSKI